MLFLNTRIPELTVPKSIPETVVEKPTPEALTSPQRISFPSINESVVPPVMLEYETKIPHWPTLSAKVAEPMMLLVTYTPVFGMVVDAPFK